MDAVARGGGRPSKSFKDILVNGSTLAGNITYSFEEKEGVPAIFISDEDTLSLALPFSLTLIGKFASSRPTLSGIRRFISRLKFLGAIQVDQHDEFNIVFQFVDENDYSRFFSHRYYMVFGNLMKVMKWSPFFDVTVELPIVPLWVSLPGLRFQFFDKHTLMNIGSRLGKPLGVDSSMGLLGNLSKARILVEIDVSKPIPEKVWIGSALSGYFQKVVIETKPPYCNKCLVFGHEMDLCSGRNHSSGSLPQKPGDQAANPKDTMGDLQVVCYRPCVVPKMAQKSGSNPGEGLTDKNLETMLPNPTEIFCLDVVDNPLLTTEMQVGQIYEVPLLAPMLHLDCVTHVEAGGPSLDVSIEDLGCDSHTIVEDSLLLENPRPGCDGLHALVLEDVVISGVKPGPSPEGLSLLDRLEERADPILVDLDSSVDGVGGVELGGLPGPPLLSDGSGEKSLASSPAQPSYPIRGMTTRSKSKAVGASVTGKSGGTLGGKRKKNKGNSKYDHAMAVAFQALFKTPCYED